MPPTETWAHVLIGGTRTLADYALVKTKLDQITAALGPVVAVSGEWRNPGYGTPQYVGASLLGEQWAHAHHFPVMRFPPEWPVTAATLHARSREMVEFLAGCEESYAILFCFDLDQDLQNTITLLERSKIATRIVGREAR